MKDTHVHAFEGLKLIQRMESDEIQSAAYLLIIIRRRNDELADESIETKLWLRLYEELSEWKASLNKIYERVYRPQSVIC